MRKTFGIQTLFVLTLLVAIVMAIVAYEAYWLTGLLATILIMNLVGAVVALVLTRGFGFPTDGGFRDPELREESTTDQSNEPERV